jgi:hypothetical protein
MKLRTELELENSRRKLADLERLIQRREESSGSDAAHDLSLESMRHFAVKLRAEIAEYQIAHQSTR